MSCELRVASHEQLQRRCLDMFGDPDGFLVASKLDFDTFGLDDTHVLRTKGLARFLLLGQNPDRLDFSGVTIEDVMNDMPGPVVPLQVRPINVVLTPEQTAAYPGLASNVIPAEARSK